MFGIEWNHVPISLERTTPGGKVAYDDDDIADSDVPGHYHDRTMVFWQSFSKSLSRYQHACFLSFIFSPFNSCHQDTVGAFQSPQSRKVFPTLVAHVRPREKDSRQVGIEYKQARLAAPDAGDFAHLHRNGPLGPQDGFVKLLLGPANHLLCRHVVVAPDDIRVDGNDDDDEASLLVPSYMYMISRRINMRVCIVSKERSGAGRTTTKAIM